MRPYKRHFNLTEMWDVRPDPIYALMVLDEGNPLISEYNADGTFVATDVPLHLYFRSVAGMRICDNLSGFSPKAGREYQIKLSGVLWGDREECKVELWSKAEGTNEFEPDELDYNESC